MMNIVDFDDLDTDQRGRCLLDGRPYTGLAIESFPDGNPRSEAHFRAGLLAGSAKEWYEDGQIESDEFFHRGMLHGPRKSWHPNGQIREVGTYQHGACLARREWGQAGDLVCRYRLRPGPDDSDRITNRAGRLAARGKPTSVRHRCKVYDPG